MRWRPRREYTRVALRTAPWVERSDGADHGREYPAPGGGYARSGAGGSWGEVSFFAVCGEMPSRTALDLVRRSNAWPVTTPVLWAGALP